MIKPNTFDIQDMIRYNYVIPNMNLGCIIKTYAPCYTLHCGLGDSLFLLISLPRAAKATRTAGRNSHGLKK